MKVRATGADQFEKGVHMGRRLSWTDYRTGVKIKLKSKIHYGINLKIH